MIGRHRFPKRSTALRPCPHCGFWVAPSQIYCPNCNQAASFSLAFLPFKLLTFGAGTLGIMALFHQLELGVTWAQFGTGLGEGLGITAGLIGMVWVGSDRLLGRSILPRKPKSCLQQDETRIQDRLKTLDDRHTPIETVRQRATHIRDGQRRQDILQALDHGLSLVQQQRDLYQIKLWEIALLRWHNQVQPLIESHRWRSILPPKASQGWWQNWNSRLGRSTPLSTQQAQQLTQQCDESLQVLEQILTTGQALWATWQAHPSGDRPEGAALMQRLEQALNSSDRLYQDLIALQASAVLKGLSHFEWDAQLALQSTDTAEFLDAFGALPSVSEFSEGFDALETEYLRLQSELEVTQWSDRSL